MLVYNSIYILLTCQTNILRDIIFKLIKMRVKQGYSYAYEFRTGYLKKNHGDENG